MGLIIWGDAYDIDVAEIDTQHKGLVKLINTLHEAIAKNETETILDSMIPQLLTYTEEHFATEEKYMDQYDYPQSESRSHREEHQKFIEEVSHLVNELQSGKKILNISLFIFLKDWLLRHIAYTDKKLGIFLKDTLADG